MRGPADVDVEWGPDRRGRLVDGRERNPHTEGGGHCPARHLPGLLPAGPDGMTVARDPSLAAGPSPDVGKSSNPASPVYPVLVARKAVRPSETEGSRRGGVEGSVAVRDPHPSISGGTALGAAPHGAGGTKSRSAPEKGLTLDRSTDVNRWSRSDARGPCNARHRKSSVRSASRTPDFAWACSHDRTAARGPALQTMKNRSGARQVTITSSRIVPSSRRRCVYRARPGVDGMSFAPRKSTNAWDSRPSMKILPMWLTSKRPTAFRTVRCSSTMPAYWRGISQPANSMNRAPAFRCHS